MLQIKVIEDTCSNYIVKRKRLHDIVHVWEVAWIKQTTGWGALKQCLAILGLQVLINIIKQLDLNTNLNKYK